MTSRRFKSPARMVSALLIAVLTVGAPAWSDDPPTLPTGRDADIASPSFLLRFVVPPGRTVAGSTASHEPEHGHVEFSADEMASRQADVTAYLEEVRSSGRPVDRSVFLEVYRRAGHFSVIHALLEGAVIDPSLSNRLGELRAEIHQEALNQIASSRKFGRRIGINDFGSGTMNAKSDIDFTLYADDSRISGADLVAEYVRVFKSLSGGLAPGQFDLVAHRWEATIPDWRTGCAVADFVQKLRTGTSLLKANPEAYFLEGAYAQQIMRRSAQGQTFSWKEALPDGQVATTHHNAATETPFFYHPDARARYAWGAAVGNWHFFHAHALDRIAQAKYILRSLDDGAVLLSRHGKIHDFAELNFAERRALVRELYGDGWLSERYLAILETAARIRQMKSTGREAYAPLMELERRQAGGIEIDDDTALRLAKDAFLRHGNRMLIANNSMGMGVRLTDWLGPDIPQGEYRTVGDDGRPKIIQIDDKALERLRYSAFFELKDGIDVMDRGQIEQLKRQNPRFAAEIDMLQRINETQRRMMLAPDDLDPRAAREYRMRLAEEVMADLHAFPVVARAGGVRAVIAHATNVAYKVEDRLQQGMVDAFAYAVSGRNPDAVVKIRQLRQLTQRTNEELISHDWMMRMNQANALLEVAKVWVEEGEFNSKVIKRIFWEGLAFLPGGGTYMQITSGAPGIITLVSTQLIPGYGPLLITVTLVKNTIQLAGMAVFEPLKRERVLLAYQGFLPPEGGGWVTLSSGQKFEVRSNVPSILDPIAGADAEDLNERREAIYTHFHREVTDAIDRDPSFPYTEEEWPWEWAEQEQRWLQARVRKHVLDWWNARGVFEGADEILAFRSRLAGADEEVFREELVSRLWKDYFTGKTRALQRDIEENEQSMSALSSVFESIASVFVGLGEMALQMAPDFAANAEAVRAYCLGEMPATPPALEILAAPRVVDMASSEESEEAIRAVPQVQFRARMWASEKDYPGPYSIRWEVRRGGETVSFDPKTEKSLETAMGDTVGLDQAAAVVATAYDANGGEIISASVPLQVEKVQIGEDIAEDEAEAEAPEGQTPVSDAPDIGGFVPTMEAAVGAANASSEAARQDCDQMAADARRVREDLGSLSANVDSLEAELGELEAGLGALVDLRSRAATAGARVTALSEDVARLRDRAARLRDTACSAVDTVKTARTTEERDRLLGEARSASEALATIEAEAAELVRSMRTEVAKIRSMSTELRTLLDRYDRFTVRLEESAAALDVAMADLEKTRESERRARRSIAEVERQRDQGAALLEEARSSIGSTEASEESAAVLEGIGAQLETIRRVASDVAGCADEAIVAEVGPAEEDAAALQDRLDGLRQRLEGLREGFQQRDLASQLKASADDAVVLLEMSEVFLETIRNRAREAASCSDAAARAPRQAAGVAVPDLVGQSEALGVAWLEDLGLQPVVRSAGPPPLASKAGTVGAQSQSADTEVPIGTSVMLFVYDSPNAVEVPTPSPAPTATQAMCDQSWPGTVLTRDPTTGTLDCLCPSGTAWSTVRSTCLSLGGTPQTRVSDCREMPGTIRNPATGVCACPVGAWDPSQGRCVDTAAAQRERDITQARQGANCEKLYSDINMLRRNSAYRGLAEQKEREARAMGCDPGRIADAVAAGDAASTAAVSSGGSSPGNNSGVLSGDCRGSITPTPSSGYRGDALAFTITIFPPMDREITRVITDNPLCRNCEAGKTGPGTFVFSSYFEGRPGTFRMTFVAYDAQGNQRCSGSSGDVRVLKR